MRTRLLACVLVIGLAVPAAHARAEVGPISASDGGVPLRDYLDQRVIDFARMLDERQNTIQQQIAAQQQALAVARSELERRLEGMNQFRSQLETQAAQFVSRDLLDARMKERDAKQELVTDRLNRIEQMQASMLGYVAGAAAVGSLCGFVVQFFIRRRAVPHHG